MRHLSALFLCLAAAGCTPKLPESPEAAKAQLTSFGNSVTEAKDGAAEGLEKVGDTVSSGVDATKSALTAVGDTVLSVTGNDQPSATQQKPAP